MHFTFQKENIFKNWCSVILKSNSETWKPHHFLIYGWLLVEDFFGFWGVVCEVFFIWEGIFLLQLMIFAILTTQSHVTKQHTLALEQLTVYTAWTLYKAKCPGINWASASIKPVPPILWFFG